MTPALFCAICVVPSRSGWLGTTQMAQKGAGLPDKARGWRPTETAHTKGTP
jgi:hypothetical protein